MAFGTTGRTCTLSSVTALATHSEHNFSFPSKEQGRKKKKKRKKTPLLTDSIRILKSFGSQLAARAQHHFVAMKHYHIGIISHKNLQLTHSLAEMISAEKATSNLK